jgi:hypothetical protein
MLGKMSVRIFLMLMLTTVESVDVKDTTPPAATSHYSIPEVIDLDSNENDSPEQHDRYGETV